MMPDLDGIELVRRARRRDPDTPIMVYTAQASVETAVTAMREGAFDYLRKTAGGQELRAAVERAVHHGSLTREVRRLRIEVERARGVHDVIGKSPVMQQLLALIERIAPSDASVLILGESGTGKELLARTIHRLSLRRDTPFVAFDCSALAPSLLESELFGHEKGAFTGAARARRGLFREAHGGTLFLDEIGDIAPEVQNKLLRVLQEREIKPVGGDTFVKVDVRILAATNKDLKALSARGVFREDLYWRLAVVPVEVPPLRHDRREDLPLLCAHILARKKPPGGSGRRWPTHVTAGGAGQARRRLSVSLREQHPRGPWRTCSSRAALLCDGDEINPQDLPQLGTAPAPARPHSRRRRPQPEGHRRGRRARRREAGHRRRARAVRGLARQGRQAPRDQPRIDLQQAQGVRHRGMEIAAMSDTAATPVCSFIKGDGRIPK